MVDMRILGELEGISASLCRGEGTGESDMVYHSYFRSRVLTGNGVR